MTDIAALEGKKVKDLTMEQLASVIDARIEAMPEINGRIPLAAQKMAAKHTLPPLMQQLICLEVLAKPE